MREREREREREKERKRERGGGGKDFRVMKLVASGHLGLNLN